MLEIERVIIFFLNKEKVTKICISFFLESSLFFLKLINDQNRAVEISIEKDNRKFCQRTLGTCDYHFEFMHDINHDSSVHPVLGGKIRDIKNKP